MNRLPEFGDLVKLLAELMIEGKISGGFGAAVDVAAPGDAETQIVVPDGCHDQLAVGVKIEKSGGTVGIGGLGKLVDDVIAGDGVHIGQLLQTVSVVGENRVLKILVVGGDVVDLLLAAVFGAFDDDIIAALGDEIAFFRNGAGVNVHFQQEAAVDDGGGPHTDAVDIGRAIAGLCLGGDEAVVVRDGGVDGFVDLFQICDVHPTASDLHLFAEQINAPVFAVIEKVHGARFDPGLDLHGQGEIIDHLIAQKRGVSGVSQKHPGFCLVFALARLQQVGFAAQLDLVGLFVLQPGGVAATLDLGQAVIVDEAAVGTDEVHGTRGFVGFGGTGFDPFPAFIHRVGADQKHTGNTARGHDSERQRCSLCAACGGQSDGIGAALTAKSDQIDRHICTQRL